jgi:hypothetical protein
MAADEIVLGGGRFGTDCDGYEAMRHYARQWGTVRFLRRYPSTTPSDWRSSTLPTAGVQVQRQFHNASSGYDHRAVVMGVGELAGVRDNRHQRTVAEPGTQGAQSAKVFAGDPRSALDFECDDIAVDHANGAKRSAAKSGWHGAAARFAAHFARDDAPWRQG